METFKSVFYGFFMSQLHLNFFIFEVFFFFFICLILVWNSQFSAAWVRSWWWQNYHWLLRISRNRSIIWGRLTLCLEVSNWVGIYSRCMLCVVEQIFRTEIFLYILDTPCWVCFLWFLIFGLVQTMRKIFLICVHPQQISCKVCNFFSFFLLFNL